MRFPKELLIVLFACAIATGAGASPGGFTDINTKQSWALDFPPGRIGGHAHTGVRWTAPHNAVISIQGGVWKLRNNDAVTVSLWVKSDKLIDRATPPPQSPSCNSQRPWPLSFEDIEVDQGDNVHLEIDGNDFVGIDLVISDGQTTWDLADGFSETENPSGPWAWGEIVVDAAHRPHLVPFPVHVEDYDTPDMGLGQPAWTGEGPHRYWSLLKSRGTVRPTRSVRFTSDLTVCAEGAAKGTWVGRFWATNGRRELAYGLMQEPAFALEVAGEPLEDGWTCTQAIELEPTQRGARHFVVELSHDAPKLTCKLHTLLDGTAVITRWLELTNNSGEVLPLTGVWPWTPTFIAAANYWGNADPPKVADNVFTLGHFTKPDHCWEGWFDWKPLPVGKTVIGCDRGQCYDDPFFAIRNEVTGEYAIGSLAWSANWQMELDYAQEGTHTLRCRIGPWATDALRVVAPGETITSPAVHMGLVAGDLDTAVQAMHEHMRRSVLPARNPDRAYLVQYALPGDQGYLSQRFGDPSGYTEQSVLANIDLAAAIGAELFIMDAAWWDIQGDWTASSTRFPHGLDPIIDYCHKKGLLFGLYAEIEKASPGSKAGQEHPEWIAWHAPYPVLNLADPEAAAYMEEQLASLIQRYRLDLFRLDFNTPTTERFEAESFERAGHAENNFWRYYDACYGIFERIRARFPDVVLQQAACGGGRNDLGIVSRFDEQYLTDGLRLPYELQNYAGQTLSLPPETLIIAHGADGAQGFGSPENLDTVLRTTFALSPAWLFAGTVGPAEAPIHPKRLERIRHYCDLYKSFIRPLLPTCKVFHHEPVSATGGVESSGWFVMEYASPDRKQGWATLVRIARKGEDLHFFRPRGLDPAKTYEVTFDNLGSKVKLSGLELMREGVPVRLEAVASSELLLFKAR